MSIQALERMVGTALVDPTFRQALLDGHRSEVIAGFELTDEERDLVLGIQARKLDGFARVLANWLDEQEAAGVIRPIGALPIY